MTGKCGSVQVRLIPAPRGTGIVGAPVPKKLLQMAGIEDCYTSARGSTGTLGNFGKVFPYTTMAVGPHYFGLFNPCKQNYWPNQQTACSGKDQLI